MSEYLPPRNIGIDLVRVTEQTALAAGRWIGSGNFEAAHRAASEAMVRELNTLDITGQIVIGEENRFGDDSSLVSGQKVGTGHGPEVDVVVDPIDGTNLVIKGRPGAISVVGISPRDSTWSPVPASYMDKIVADQEAAHALVPQCLDAPAPWVLALVARAKHKAVRDLTVLVLDRPRHQELIEEIRVAGAQIMLREEGDTEGALLAATPQAGIDLLMGIGGASQGVIAASAVIAMGGAMLARLAPQSETEARAIAAAGLDDRQILTATEIISGDEIFFAATGITSSTLLPPIRISSSYTETSSLLVRARTGTRRFVNTQHVLTRRK